MPRGRPVTDETRTRVRALIEAGGKRNEIARTLGLSGATVTKLARELGLSFDRSATAAATEAHRVDLAAERLRLAEEMMAAGREALQEIRGQVTVYNFGGKDNTFEERTLDRAPMSMRREALTAAGIAFDKATRIVERGNDGLESAVGVLDTVAGALTAAADVLRTDGDADSDTADGV